MSDRVARLAELRRRRKEMEADAETKLAHDDEIRNPDPPSHDTGVRVLEDEHPEELASSDTDNAENRHTQSQAHLDGAEYPNAQRELAAAIQAGGSYNSDLIRDIAPLLEQAKRSTNRAIAQIIQEKHANTN